MSTAAQSPTAKVRPNDTLSRVARTYARADVDADGHEDAADGVGRCVCLLAPHRAKREQEKKSAENREDRDGQSRAGC